MLAAKHETLPVVGHLPQKVSHISAECVHEKGVVFHDEHGSNIVLNRPLQYRQMRAQTAVTASAGSPETWNTNFIAINGIQYRRPSKRPSRFFNPLPETG